MVSTARVRRQEEVKIVVVVVDVNVVLAALVAPEPVLLLRVRSPCSILDCAAVAEDDFDDGIRCGDCDELILVLIDFSLVR
jgi:hypothetical protein